MKEWTEIGLTLWEIIKKFKRKKKSLDKKAVEWLKDGSRITQICAELVREDGLNIIGFFLVMVHNGGKKIIPHGFKYRSIITGDYRENWMKNFEFENYQFVRIDHEFEGVLKKIVDQQEYGIGIEDLSNGELRRNFEYEGAKFAKFYCLHATEEAVWFCAAVAGYEDERFEDTDQKQRISWAVNSIKNIIIKYHEKV